MPTRREVVKRRVEPALHKVMQPGDQITAGTWALSGSAPAWDALAGLPAIAGGVAGAAGLVSNYSPPADLAAIGLGLAPFALFPLQLRRSPVFVAVTRDQLICYRLSRIGNQPARLLFCAPLAAVRMTILGNGALRWRSVRYRGPGAGDRGLRLNVPGRWRADLDEVLAALRAGGAAVDGTSLERRPGMLPGFLDGTGQAHEHR
jgi:hypothetical protein